MKTYKGIKIGDLVKIDRRKYPETKSGLIWRVEKIHKLNSPDKVGFTLANSDHVVAGMFIRNEIRLA